MIDYTELARRYLGAWNETDPTTRRTLVGALFSADAHYTDPMAVAEGREAITATIGAVQDQFPGFTTTGMRLLLMRGITRRDSNNRFLGRQSTTSS